MLHEVESTAVEAVQQHTAWPASHCSSDQLITSNFISKRVRHVLRKARRTVTVLCIACGNPGGGYTISRT